MTHWPLCLVSQKTLIFLIKYWLNLSLFKDIAPPTWPQVSQDPQMPLERPPPPPSQGSSFLDESELSIVTREEFLENIQRRRQLLEQISNDKTIPYSARHYTQQWLESLEKSVSGDYFSLQTTRPILYLTWIFLFSQLFQVVRISLPKRKLRLGAATFCKRGET